MVTMENKIRKLINEGTPTVNTRIWSPWGTTAEAAAASGSFDYLEFLAEYVPYDRLWREPWLGFPTYPKRME